MTPSECWLPWSNSRATTLISLGDHYTVAPLLRLFGSSTPRLVLSLAEGGLRLLRGTAHHLEPVPLPESFPKNRAEVMEFEKAAGLDPKHSTQFRSSPGMAYHGEGPKETVEMEFTKRYYREIGEALSNTLDRDETILLAGVHERIALFRKVNPDLPVLFTELAGNHESQATESFIAEALATLAEVERSENRLAVTQTRELGSAWWSTDNELCLQAAREGRVHGLFVNVSSLGEPGIEELVLEVLRHGGSVRPLQSEELVLRPT